jgi:hypothetical protein
MNHEGSCLCGAVQFASSIDPLDIGYCHCTMCQKLSGSTVLPWASFLSDYFAYVQGNPRIYRSSSHGQREFCGECGSQIAFRSTDRPGTVEINIGTLQNPEKLSPQCHIWWASRIPWFDTVDSLPRYPGPAPTTNET